MAQIPVAIQGKTGMIHAAVIRGKATLLLGRPTLEKLKTTVNFASGTVTMLGGQRSKRSAVSETLPVSSETPQAIDPAKTLSLI